MISEYALDPESICEWRFFKHVALGFGFTEGRVFAKYPQDWLKRAYQRAIGLDQNTRYQVETWLADRAKPQMVDSRKTVPYEPAQAWLDNVLVEHNRKAFRAIITDRPDSDEPPILNVADLDSSKATWKVERQRFLARQPENLGPLISPLLIHARQIRIVDPYFTADPDQLRMLLACIRCFAEMTVRTIDTLELHVSGEKVKGGTIVYVQKRLREACPSILPDFTIVRWQPEYVHNRLILADCGGFILGDTLREHDYRPDQVTLLEDGTFKKWWKYFDAEENQASLAPNHV